MTVQILLVDDEPNILLSLQFLMKRAGYQVSTATDGEQALSQVEALTPDLILLDINMPKLNGYAVCERIRANPAWQHIRIVLLTAKGREVEKEKGLALGADAYITKPFSNQALIDKVQTLLSTER
jgi:two-component system alkaline phosphatase synthesis response regulator PhoP